MLWVWGGVTFTVMMFLVGLKTPDGKLHVHVLDVGQGDASLIESPTGVRVLIDSGPDLLLLERLSALLPFHERHIDLLILTRAVRERLGALPEIMKRFSVGAVLLPASSPSLPFHRWLLAEIQDYRTPVLSPQRRSIDIGGSHIEVFPVGASLVLRLRRGNDAVLFAGSITNAEEKSLLRSGMDLRADILLAPRHGNRTGTSKQFLQKVRPKTAVISVGKGAPYGYPHDEVLERLNKNGIGIRRTDRESSLHFVFP